MKDSKLALEKDITIDSKREPLSALNAAEAKRGCIKRVRVGRRKLYQLPLDDGLVCADVECQEPVYCLSCGREAVGICA